jgi:hypothetical protein
MNIAGNLKLCKYLAVIFLTLFSCKSKEVYTDDYSKKYLVQISMSTNGSGIDTSGGFAIELNNNLSAFYLGGSQNELIGNYSGKVLKEHWSKITYLVLKQKNHDTTLLQHSFEDNYFDLFIKLQDTTYYINGYYSSAPQYIKDICKQLLWTRKKIKFTKTSYSNSFKVKAYSVHRTTNDSIHFVVPKVENF